MSCWVPSLLYLVVCPGNNLPAAHHDCTNWDFMLLCCHLCLLQCVSHITEVLHDALVYEQLIWVADQGVNLLLQHKCCVLTSCRCTVGCVVEEAERILLVTLAADRVMLRTTAVRFSEHFPVWRWDQECLGKPLATPKLASGQRHIGRPGKQILRVVAKVIHMSAHTYRCCTTARTDCSSDYHGEMFPGNTENLYSNVQSTRTLQICQVCDQDLISAEVGYRTCMAMMQYNRRQYSGRQQVVHGIDLRRKDQSIEFKDAFTCVKRCL